MEPFQTTHDIPFCAGEYDAVVSVSFGTRPEDFKSRVDESFGRLLSNHSDSLESVVDYVIPSIVRLRGSVYRML
jgi:hypothetical protein